MFVEEDIRLAKEYSKKPTLNRELGLNKKFKMELMEEEKCQCRTRYASRKKLQDHKEQNLLKATNEMTELSIEHIQMFFKNMKYSNS